MDLIATSLEPKSEQNSSAQNSKELPVQTGQKGLSNFAVRLLTASILIPVVIGLLFFCLPFFMQALIFIVFLSMAYEWKKMACAPFGFVSLFVFFASITSFYFLQTLSIIIFLSMMLPFFVAYRHQKLFMMGGIYMSLALLGAYEMVLYPWVFLWIFVIVWGNDTWAYFVGRFFGGPKLCARISPKKTWSGFVGGVVGGTIFSGALAFFINAMTVLHQSHQGMYAPYALLAEWPFALSFLLSFVSHGGDLMESAAKRYYGVKDSGAMIPGHGGFLDRLDSLLAVVIIFHMLNRAYCYFFL